METDEFRASYYPYRNESFLFYRNATIDYVFECNDNHIDATILKGEYILINGTKKFTTL